MVAALTADSRFVILFGASTALIWNYFLIPPIFKFSINESEDRILIFSFIIVSGLMAYFAKKIREINHLSLSNELDKILFTSISHELKTPLTTIFGSTATLQWMNPSNETLPLIQKIDAASDDLESLIENILNFSRFHHNQYLPKIEVIDLSQTVKD